MSLSQRLIAASLFAAVAALPAYAQTTIEPTTPGISQPAPVQGQAVETEVDKDRKNDVSIEESAILPSAGGHEGSRAPSMDLDCEKKSEDCVEPLTTDSPGPTLSTPAARSPQ